MLKIETLVVGALQTNCYLVWDVSTKEALVIDPGDDGEYIIRRIQDLIIQPRAIFATHGHFDHVCASLELKMAFRIPFYLHQADEFLLSRAQNSARHWTGIEVDPPAPADGYLRDNEKVELGSQYLRVMFTPGHTPGSVCLYCKEDKVLFSGDTIFADGGVGRTDYRYSSEVDLHESITKIFQLTDEIMVFSGHGRETTIGQERDFYDLS